MSRKRAKQVIFHYRTEVKAISYTLLLPLIPAFWTLLDSGSSFDFALLFLGAAFFLTGIIVEAFMPYIRIEEGYMIVRERYKPERTLISLNTITKVSSRKKSLAISYGEEKETILYLSCREEERIKVLLKSWGVPTE